MNNCEANTSRVDREVVVAKLNYEREAKSMIFNLIGIPTDIENQFSGNSKRDKFAKKAYSKLRNALYDDIMKLGVKSKYDADIAVSRMAQWADIFYKRYKIFGLVLNRSTGEIDPIRVTDAAKLVPKLINAQNSRFGKDRLPQKEREILPVEFFTMKSDNTGAMFELMDKSNSAVEESRRKSAPYINAFASTYSKLKSALDNAMANTDGIWGYEFTMVDPKLSTDIILNSPDIGIRGIKTISGNSIIFLGTIKKNGKVYHDIIDEKTGKRGLIHYNDISKKVLKDSILRKYVYELTNDIMDGQTRYVEWKENPSGEDLKYIKNILNKWRLTLKVREGIGEDFEKGINEVHIGEHGGYKIAFVMVPDKNMVVGGRVVEGHRAYIISHVTPEGKRVDYFSQKTKESDKIKISEFPVFKNGFYKANEFRNHGRAINGMSERGWYFGDNAFRSYMKYQPNKLLMEAAESPAELSQRRIDERLQYYGIWNAIAMLRQQYANIAADIESMAKEEQKLVEEWFGDNGAKLRKILERFPDLKNKTNDMNIFDIFKYIQDLFGMENRIYVDKAGNVSTPNMFFERQGNNYTTHVFNDDLLDRHLDNTIEEMEEKLIDLENSMRSENDFVAVAKLAKNIELTKKNIDKLRVSRLIRAGMNEQAKSEIALINAGKKYTGSKSIVAQRNVYTEARSMWTNPVYRIKSQPTYHDYVSNVFYSFTKNRLMFSALEAIEKFSRINEVQSSNVLDWALNRTMVSMSDKRAVGTIFGKDVSLDRMASFLTRTRGVEYTVDDADKIVKLITGSLSAMLLGMWGAVGNNTQRVNDFIGYGMHYYSRVRQMLDTRDLTEKAMVDAIIDNAGTDEVVQMFIDAIADAQDLTVKDDMGFIDLRPLIPVHIPRKVMRDMLKLASLGRKKFVDQKIPQLDKTLNALESARIKKINNILKRIEEYRKILGNRADKDKTLKLLDREEKRLKDESQIRDVRYLRELYFDLMFSEKNSNTEKIIKERFIKLAGRVSENRLKRIITWKLSWFFKAKDSAFTFTGGERRMRKETTLMNILVADDMGLLGSSRKTTTVKNDDGVSVQVPERYLSSVAIHVARNGVKNTMYGMSMQHLGDASIGFGKVLMMYKSYQINQMIHDWTVGSQFMNSTDPEHSKISRIMKAYSYIMTPGRDYDPSDPRLDHSAIQFVRLLNTRVLMSVIGVMTEATSIGRLLYMSSAFREFSVMIRGGENPMFGIPLRIAVNMLLFALADIGDDDDALKEISKWLPDVFRLLLPVAITFPIISVWRAITGISNAIDFIDNN